jgi:hypothetical protein
MNSYDDKDAHPEGGRAQHDDGWKCKKKKEQVLLFFRSWFEREKEMKKESVQFGE